MTEQQANTFCYILTGVGIEDFAKQIIKDFNDESKKHLFYQSNVKGNEKLQSIK